jgi:digalactosyldiacylglycerol synthase
MFVHGVSPAFIKVGERKAEEIRSNQEAWSKGVYFIGKVLWAKGYTELLQRMREHAQCTGENVHVDVFGSGPDLKAVEDEAHRNQLSVTFNGARDHADSSLQDYKVCK